MTDAPEAQRRHKRTKYKTAVTFREEEDAKQDLQIDPRAGDRKQMVGYSIRLPKARQGTVEEPPPPKRKKRRSYRNTGHFRKPVPHRSEKKKGQYVYRLLGTSSLKEGAM
jgi:hypothetical protein